MEEITRRPETTLDQRVVGYAAKSVSTNTLRAYKSALRRFDEWAANQDAESADSLIARYLAHRTDSGVAAASLKMDVAALRFRERMRGGPDPVGLESQTVLRGAVRTANREGRGRGQVADVRFDTVNVAARLAAREGLRGQRDAAIMHVGSDGLLRVSELAALNVEDLRFHEDGSGELLIRRSKTDQDAEGQPQYIEAETVEAVKAWLVAAGVSSGAVFRRISGANIQGRLSDRSIRTVVKKRAQAVGVDGASGHSLRIGSALDLAAEGFDLPQIMQVGRWSSAGTVATYIKSETARRSAMAKMRLRQRLGGDPNGV